MKREVAMLDEHLTKPNPVLADQMRASFPGMAHFALTGPPGRTCRECEHWGAGGLRGDDYYAATNLLKPRACGKFRSLMRLGKKSGPAVPYYAAACRHFVVAEKIPTIERPPDRLL